MSTLVSCCQNSSAQERALVPHEQRRDSAKRIATFQPAVDVVETPEAFTVTMDLPGATRDAVDIAYEKGELAVTARIQPRLPQEARRLLLEYEVGAYQRTFRLGETIDTSAIEATLADGVLTVRMAKTEQARPRRIEVQGA